MLEEGNLAYEYGPRPVKCSACGVLRYKKEDIDAGSKCIDTKFCEMARKERDAKSPKPTNA